MGKKYIVELRRCERLYKAYINGNGKPNLTWLSPEVDLTPYTEPDLEQVRKEVWEAARKIAVNADYGGLTAEALREIFSVGTASIAHIFDDFSASEAIAKIKAYEESKQEISVGDEVGYYGVANEHGDVCYSGVVLEIREDDYLVMEKTGKTYALKKNLVMSKTGRHFTEIARVLAKMKEA